MSLLDGRTAASLVAEFKLERARHKGTILIVEGDSDSRFWKRRLHSSCRLMIAGARSVLVEGVCQLDTLLGAGYLGLPDADFDPLGSHPHSSSNLVLVEPHDLEGLLIASPAWDIFIEEHGDSAKIKALESKEGCSLKNTLYQRALPTGRLRWLAHRENRDIDFKRLAPTHKQWFDNTNWVLDISKLNSAAAQLWGCDLPVLEQKLTELPPALPEQICQGHDLLSILSAGWKHICKRGQLSEEAIASFLRAALLSEELKRLPLYEKFQAWKVSNQGYWLVD